MILDRYNKPITPLIDLILQNQKAGMIVVEIGVWQGETSVYTAPLVKDGKVFLVDWFCGNAEVPDEKGPHAYLPENHSSIKENLINNLAEQNIDHVTILDGKSEDIAQQFDDKSIDICFIDADHSYEGVLRDIAAYRPKMKDNGIMCGHDYDGGHPEVIKAVHESFDPSIVRQVNDKNNPQPCWVVYL